MPSLKGKQSLETGQTYPDRAKIFGAPQEATTFGQHDFDYFTLQPAEREVFELDIGILPGYYYHYRVGVLYSYKGNEDVKWIDRKFVAARPERVRLITNQGPGEYRVAEQPSAQPPLSTLSNISSSADVKRDEQAMQKYQFSFTLPQSGPNE